MARVKPSLKMALIISKLEHATGSEFSAMVKPEECELLLSVVLDYYKRLDAASWITRGPSTS